MLQSGLCTVLEEEEEEELPSELVTFTMETTFCLFLVRVTLTLTQGGPKAIQSKVST
jgi:hypothetical protein